MDTGNESDAVVVASSWIESISYDADTQVLTVSLDNGNDYDYKAVPPAVYDAFLKAPSKGSFFRIAIRERYPVVQG